VGRNGKRSGIGSKKKAARMLLREQLEAFREKFGRDPLPHEPVFFDPDGDDPVPLTEEKMMQDLAGRNGHCRSAARARLREDLERLR
jgi:hypothetical protein